MDSFDKVIYGVHSSTCTTDDKLRMNLMNQRRKTIDEWILKRKEAWEFQEELLRSLTNKPTKDSWVFNDKISKKAKEMKAVHKELLGMVEARERREEGSRMFVPRRVFLFNVDTFKETQQVEDFDNTNTNPGNSVSTPKSDGSPQGPVKLTDAKYSCEVQPLKRQGVFSRLKKYFGF